MIDCSNGLFLYFIGLICLDFKTQAQNDNETRFLIFNLLFSQLGYLLAQFYLICFDLKIGKKVSVFKCLKIFKDKYDDYEVFNQNLNKDVFYSKKPID